jgi:hypothetical protein
VTSQLGDAGLGRALRRRPHLRARRGRGTQDAARVERRQRTWVGEQGVVEHG